MKYVHNNVAWAMKLQADLEEYMDACVDSVDGDEEIETVSEEPFCGCNVCYYREIIMWLVPEIIDAYRAGIIEEDEQLPKLSKQSLAESFEYDVDKIYDDAKFILLRKHNDYGPKNIAQSPGGALNGLRVRMWDKIARINNLMDSGVSPSNESLRDSFLDLMNYAAIAQLVIDERWPND